MSEDYRHHVATRIVVIPVPYEIGSPKVVRPIKPSYPQQDRLPAWKPARHPPRRVGKAEALRQFLDRWARQEEALREFMKPNAAMLRAWLCRGAVPA